MVVSSVKISGEVALVIRAAYKSGVINFDTYNRICQKYGL